MSWSNHDVHSTNCISEIHVSAPAPVSEFTALPQVGPENKINGVYVVDYKWLTVKNIPWLLTFQWPNLVSQMYGPVGRSLQYLLHILPSLCYFGSDFIFWQGFDIERPRTPERARNQGPPTSRSTLLHWIWDGCSGYGEVISNQYVLLTAVHCILGAGQTALTRYISCL